jgi:hypothetical protein
LLPVFGELLRRLIRAHMLRMRPKSYHPIALIIESDLGESRRSPYNILSDAPVRFKMNDLPSLTTSPTENSCSPSFPAGRTNSQDMLTDAPVGGGIPMVDRAREVTVSVSLECQYISSPQTWVSRASLRLTESRTPPWTVYISVPAE